MKNRLLIVAVALSAAWFNHQPAAGAEATPITDVTRPSDPLYEKWLPILNANPAAKPRPVPNPLPPSEMVPGPYSPDWKAPCWKQIQGPQWLYDGKLGIGLHWGPSSLEGRFGWPALKRYSFEKGREDFDTSPLHP